VTGYGDTLAFLYSLQSRGMKFGLRNIRSLLADTGHPERAYPTIHVAGTNGKGSTSSLIASAYAESGLRAGLYTSPHLVNFTERIRINGKEIQEARLVAYVRILRGAIEEHRATFFEATTCVAFLYFADEGVDIAVIEAGLGGRLDATNVLRPLVSVITNIGLEHTEHLGNTVAKIAREKGGIIKQGIPLVTASEDPVALRVLRAIATRRSAPFFRAQDLVAVAPGPGGKGYTLSSGSLRIPSVVPVLVGRHQEMNARLALSALLLAGRRSGHPVALPMLSPPRIARAFSRVTFNTGIRGRFQYVGRGKRILIDVAHNPDGMEVLAATIRDLRRKPAVAVLGVMKDKKYREMLRVLAGVCPTIVAVAPRLDRALRPGKLVSAGREMGIRVLLGGTVARGMALARTTAGRGTVLVTGSHYVAGEALKALVGENA
jgi:dihydrofolate synthase / folylpolyglutamate synthase